MDMSKLTDKVKINYMRTAQKVLEGLGVADKTVDDSNTTHNFQALGSFTSQLKATVQAANSNFEKLSTAQSHLAGQIQSYVHSELSGETDLPPGELYEFFSHSPNPDAHAHAVLLQDVTEKFYAACSEINNQALRVMNARLEDAVIRPIMRDEEFNAVTKDLVEDKKKATTDFDAYRRIASNSSTPMEQEKNEAKLRIAKEKFEHATRKLHEHIDLRNQIRCKLLVHGILTTVQQYCSFYASAVDILKESASSIKPLLDLYQLNEQQLLATVNLDAPLLSNTTPRQGAAAPPSKPLAPGQKLSTADSIFAEQNGSAGAHAPGGPARPATTSKPPVTAGMATQGPPASGQTRHASPGPTDSRLEDLMQHHVTSIKKAPPPAPTKPSAPMNMQKPPAGATLNNSQGLNQASNQPPSGQAPTPPPKAAPLVQDLLSDWGTTPAASTAAPSATPSVSDDFLGLGNFSSTPAPSAAPPPASTATKLFDDDLLNFSSSSIPAAAAAASQPAPLQPTPSAFGAASTLPNSNLPNSAAFQTTPTSTPLQPTPLQPTPMRNSPVPTPNAAAAKPAPNVTPRSGYGSQPPSMPSYGNTVPSGGAAPSAYGYGGGTPFYGAQSQPAQAQPQQSSANQFLSQNVIAEQEERQELNPAITAKIDSWATRGGRQNNLRSLLSTLHEVIWVDSGWDALPLSELVTPAQVKKAYLRANKIVHPDKVANGTVEQKLIAQRLFEALRVSYETFCKDEVK